MLANREGGVVLAKFGYLYLMTMPLPGFDTWLLDRLQDCACAAGDDVNSYVARAVAARMIEDLRCRGSVDTKDAAVRLNAAGYDVGSPLTGDEAVLADPDRLLSLYATGLLDSPAEDAYDRITQAAADALGAPSAALSLVDVDRQFLKSAVGTRGASVKTRQRPLEHSFCKHVVAQGSVKSVPDARLDPVLKDYPDVRDGAMVAYLGIPLIDRSNHAIGTLCVSDTRPRRWSTGHLEVLTDFAEVASRRIFGA